MQQPWTMEVNASYHRQQLLAEAASERLAAQARPAEGARPAPQANRHWMARKLVAPIVAALTLKASA